MFDAGGFGSAVYALWPGRMQSARRRGRNQRGAGGSGHCICGAACGRPLGGSGHCTCGCWRGGGESGHCTCCCCCCGRCGGGGCRGGCCCCCVAAPATLRHPAARRRARCDTRLGFRLGLALGLAFGSSTTAAGCVATTGAGSATSCDWLPFTSSDGMPRLTPGTPSGNTALRSPGNGFLVLRKSNASQFAGIEIDSGAAAERQRKRATR